MKILALIIFILLSCSNAFAATINAASCSNGDIQSAIDSSSTGDTVAVPQCTETTWTGGVLIPSSKAITLQGAGYIDGNGNYSATGSIINMQTNSITVRTAAGNPSTRVTGFKLSYNTTNGASGAILMEGATGPHYAGGTNWRIDNNYLNYTGPGSISIPGLHTKGWTYGVFHNNVIYHSGRAIFIEMENYDWEPEYGVDYDGDGSWDTDLGGAIDWGGPKAVYIEDNWLIGNDTQYFYNDQVIDSHFGARIVFRYNYVENGEYQSHSGSSNHGRSTLHQEIYNNHFVSTTYAGAGVIYRQILLRGGTFVVYNNVFSGSFRAFYQMQVDYPAGAPDNESCPDPNLPSPYTADCDDYPCIDQPGTGADSTHSGKTLVPGYVWGNTQNGAAIEMVNGGCGTAVVVEGRDWINGTAKPGYTAYTYPHPLRSGDVPPSDETPPVLSSATPTGILECTHDPMPITEGIYSNEAATVKIHATDVTYDNMGTTLTAIGNYHYRSLERACGATYGPIYARGMDTATNKNSSSATIGPYTIQSAPVFATGHSMSIAAGGPQSFVLTASAGTFSILVPQNPGQSTTTYTWVEAEAATLTSPMVSTADATASGGYYVSSPVDSNGVATFAVTLSAGNYYVWGRVKVDPTGGENSFFVNFKDYGDNCLWRTPEGEAAWAWDKVSSISPEFDPYVWSLPSGNHTLYIAAREANTKIDKILITSDANYTPSGAGE